jgi:hypothetical protein
VSPTEARHLELSPEQAVALSVTLTALGSPVLAAILAAGAATLAPHDHQGHGRERPRVADDRARPTGRRYGWKLIMDVFDVLERHGYRKASDLAGGRAALVIADLVAVYEGADFE